MAGLLEREREVATVVEALELSRAGTGGAVLVWGPAGIGKTSVLDAVRSAASAAGVTMLRARGAELEREFGFGVARQLFEPVLAAATDVERKEWLEGAAGRAARLLDLPGSPVEAEHPDDVDPSFAVLHGLYWLCVQLTASTGPLLLIIDDAQWADLASLRFLAFLLTRIDELQLCVVAAVRAGDEGAATELLTDLANSPTSIVVEPASLTLNAVGRLLRDRLGNADDSLIARCLSSTGGVPFLVEQFAAHVHDLRRDESPSDVEVPAGRALARWVRSRLSRLGPDAVNLAQAVAVLETADLGHVCDLAGLDLHRARAAWDGLARAQILSKEAPLTFVHTLVRRAVYDDIGRARREAGHRRAATLLAGSGAAAETVAEHLLAVDPTGDDWVVDSLNKAATAASAAGAPESAVVFLRRALIEPPLQDRRSEIALALGRVEFYLGDAAARTHLKDGVKSAQGVTRAMGATLLAYASAGTSAAELGQSLRLLDEVADDLSIEHPSVSTAVQTAAASLCILDADVAKQNQARLSAARERAQSPSATRGALALAGVIAVQSNEPSQTAADLARHAMAQSIEDTQAFEAPVTELHIAMTLLWSGDRLAQQAFDTAVRAARHASNPVLVAILSGYRACWALERGHLGEAEADAMTTVSTLSADVFGYFWVVGLAAATQALLAQGRLDDIERLLTSADPVVDRPRPPEAMLRLARGQVRLVQGQYGAALEDFLAAGRVATRLGLDSPSWLPWRSSATAALLAQGDTARAAEFACAELALARTSGNPRALAVALCATARTVDGDDGLLLLEQAVGLLDTAEARLEHARAQYELGARLRRAGRRSDSRPPLRAALATAQRLGAARLVDAASAELRASGARPRLAVANGRDALTASEARVVDLAVNGLTNRQIAQRLFVTDRTVEGHLTGAFRKLGITSRDQLREAL